MVVAETGLLDARSCAAYLRSAGIAADDVEVHPLAGGVSNVVLHARSAAGSVVVKQALPLLRVADRWEAKRERTLTEAAALRIAADLTPDLVPPVVHVDVDRCLLVIEAAAPTSTEWKRALLDGRIDVGIGARLGSALAGWHVATAADPALGSPCDDPEAFRQLRIDPYHRTVQQRHPEVAADLTPLVDELSQRRTCLVHGDFSPKNVLAGPTQLWVVDFEVAHIGTPEFDPAFLFCHLLLKAIHRPPDAPRLLETAGAFWSAYELGLGGELTVRFGHVMEHAGALLLARVAGKSPAEYLDDAGRTTAWAMGLDLLRRPVRDLGELGDRVKQALR